MSDWLTDPIKVQPITPGGWLRVMRRGLTMLVVVVTGLITLLALRLIEAPIHGRNRPWTPFITQTVCRLALAIMGLRREDRGQPMREKGAVVANHSSWLDIFVLNAGARIYFVSKAEVAGWPGIGWLARATGTLFITRKATEARRQQALFDDRIRAGHQLLFFPEGTSTDAIRVLPFKSTLFQAFFADGLDRVMHIQPVTVIYHAPEGEDARFYGWWGDMEFGQHFLRMLAAPRHGRVEVIWHASVPVDAFEGRKRLAQYTEDVIRTSHVLAAPALPPEASELNAQG